MASTDGGTNSLPVDGVERTEERDFEFGHLGSVAGTHPVEWTAPSETKRGSDLIQVIA